MTASGRGIFRSAVLGFSITAAFVSYQLLTDMQSAVAKSSPVMVSFLVLCPPSILSVALRGPEIGTNGFYLLWGLIGLLNAALYAVVRSIISRRLKRAD
jgi:hypothetical protein